MSCSAYVPWQYAPPIGHPFAVGAPPLIPPQYIAPPDSKTRTPTPAQPAQGTDPAQPAQGTDTMRPDVGALAMAAGVGFILASVLMGYKGIGMG